MVSDFLDVKLEKAFTVLILVLMEDGLGPRELP